MRVRDVMSTEVVTVLPQSTYEEVAKILYEQGLSGVPVLDETGKLIGMISEKTLFRALYPRYRNFFVEGGGAYRNQEAAEHEIDQVRKHPVGRYMQTRVVTIDPDAPILRAGSLMLAYNFHRLPVLDRDALVGIVTREDIFGAILKHRLDF